MQQRRVQKLRDEQQKLLDGYYAGAIPLDLLKAEQERIGGGLAQAEERLNKLTTRFDRIAEVITGRRCGSIPCMTLTRQRPNKSGDS